MQSKTEDFFVEIGSYDIFEEKPRNIELYEEYSQRMIDETIKTRRDSFERANSEQRKRMADQVNAEVEGFHAWLRGTKNLDSDFSHYCSVSLKSLLLGLPMGVQVASLFDAALKAHRSP